MPLRSGTDYRLVCGRDEHAYGPLVAIRVADEGLSPPVAFVRRALHNVRAGGTRKLFGPVGIDAEQPELRAQATHGAASEVGVPGVLIVRVVGVEHHFGGPNPDRREIDVLVVHVSLEDSGVELCGHRGIAHDEVERQRRQKRAVSKPGHPRVALPELRAYLLGR